MEKYFQNKNIVVTGAGQGIGRGICEKLSTLGANVIAISRSAGPLVLLKKEHPSIKTIELDLADWNKTKTTLQEIKVPIHGLVNNAGVAVIKPITELTEEDFDYTMNVNFKAVFNVTQSLLPQIVSGGSIVNISSLAGLSSLQGHSVYSSSKAALDSFTRSLALELGPRKIRANSINPTVILTRMSRENWSDPAKSNSLISRIPLGRFGEVEEVVDPVCFLLSDQSSFINGTCMPIEGGFSAA